MVTPFDESEDIDLRALQGEAEYLIGVGCTALTVGGSTGEGAGFTPDEVREAVSLGKAAREAGADALQVTPPHYLIPPGPDDTVEYYRAIGQAVGLPIVVYNVVPWATIDVPTLVRLLDLPNVAGVKQSGGD